jgi:hypothetical protein
VTAAADGAGDDEVTPAEIAAELRQAIASAELRDRPGVVARLGEALDAVSDGMPEDYVATILRSALGSGSGG